VTQIRECGPADAAAVSRLLQQLGYSVTPEQAARHIRALGTTGCDPIFLALADGKIIGLVACHVCRMLQYPCPVMRVTALVVDERARRLGVGVLLMQHAEQRADAAGCGFVELTSAMDRGDAHALYRGIGYEANSLRFRKSLQASRESQPSGAAAGKGGDQQ
jgi:GNAT superfamily N-acetyltransferase